MIERPIPSSGASLPVVGLGTWQTFDVPLQGNLDAQRQVLHTLHGTGGRLIDSSPMYGQAETVVGTLTRDMPAANDFFYATKVWTEGRTAGIRQMEASLQKMERTSVELMQVHNLVDWKTHLDTLRGWKEEGRVRYIGITHYTDAAHGELENVLSAHPVDFVQFNYSIAARHAEKRLLRAAADRGVATLINRPFGEGGLFARVRGQQLPAWVAAYGIQSWSQLFLKFIIAHPAVTCVIPATRDPRHAAENGAAGSGPLPDEAAREKMAALLQL